MEKLCNEHSGIEAKIFQLVKSDDEQWKEINGMKRLMTVSLGMLVMTLLGVIVNLAIAVIR